MRHGLSLAVCLVSLCHAASGAPTPESDLPKLLRDQAVENTDSQVPSWVLDLPSKMGVRFFIGEYHGFGNKEEALEKAWVSAFVRIGMTQFPEVSLLSSESVETLKSAQYKRKFVMKLEMVDWTGVAEATEFGSPYVSKEGTSGEYTVYRLLRWSESDIEDARKKIKEAKKYEIPPTPEMLSTAEKGLVEAIVKMKKVVRKIATRDSTIGKILGEVKCGVKISDLRKVLGEPDWKSDSFDPRSYRWGTYGVEADPENTFVQYIMPNNGLGIARKICNR
jgi:hypothetical protein